MVELEDLSDPELAAELRVLVERHVQATGSPLGARILRGWEGAVRRFVVVMPKDYKRMNELIRQKASEGMSGAEALMAAFEANNKDAVRVAGN